MPELLLELGCEELPSSFVRRAYQDFEAAVTSRIRVAGIAMGDAASLGTPRRLIIQVKDVDVRQPDSVKRVRGPAIVAAFDPTGSPTKALEGFCRGQGADPAQVQKEGEHVWLAVQTKGKPTVDVLSELLPDAIKSLTFEKAMRWGSLRMRFARPIRWILAAFDGKAIPFEIDGIVAGVASRGHRFNSNDRFEAISFDQLVRELRVRQVEPDPAAREQTIREESAKVASPGWPEMSEALVAENVFLTEWPTAICAEFREEFLELPGSVLVTAMAKHEKFFPVRDNSGMLTNRFVSIRNGGTDDVVAKGNAWVLNARFNDAKFFFDEDSGSPFDEFLEKTKGIVFQDKLGTVHQRAMRLTELAGCVAQATRAPDNEVEFARKAGLYAKADLSTGLVSELPALQGQIGAEYAKREKFDVPVCWAIASQYDLALNPAFDCEGSRTSARLLIADQLDKLAGYFGIGQTPSGSSDPYGLRRAASMLIQAALRWPSEFPDYAPLLERAVDFYREQGFDLQPAQTALTELFRSRYNSIFENVRHDIVDAALLNDYLGQSEELRPQAVRFRVSVLQRIADDTAFVQTATRPQNIVTAAVNKGIGFTFHEPLENLDYVALNSKEGAELAAEAKKVRIAVDRAVVAESAEDVIREILSLAGPINNFFDLTMVMADDEAIRAARLSLLHGVNLILRKAGDFSKIVVAG